MTKRLSPVLNEVAPGYVQWWCPGCKESHHIPVASTHKPGSNWGYNGNPVAPTFTPSVFVRSGHHVPGWKAGDGCWCEPDPDGEPWGFHCHSCHVYITDGRINFLSDCSHELAGQTVDMVEFPMGDDR